MKKVPPKIDIEVNIQLIVPVDLHPLDQAIQNHLICLRAGSTDIASIAYILREWKRPQDELRDFLGDKYQDFNLVVSLPNGRPCEESIILKEFSKLRGK